MIEYPNIQENLAALFVIYFVGGSIFWGVTYFCLDYKDCRDTISSLIFAEYILCFVIFILGKKIGSLRRAVADIIRKWLFFASFFGLSVFTINFGVHWFPCNSGVTKGFLIANLVYYALHIFIECIIEITYWCGIDISPYHYNYNDNNPQEIANPHEHYQMRVRRERSQPRETEYVIEIEGFNYDNTMEVPKDREFIIDPEANTIGIPNEKAVCIFTQENYPNKTTISVLRCGHHFQKKYIETHLETSFTCPICRHDQDLEHPLEKM